MNTKRKVLSLLMALMLVLVCFLAVGCGGDEQLDDPTPPAKTEWPEAGVYYFSAATDEYTLTLNVGDTFSLYVKGESLAGSYTLSDKNLVLDFNKDGKENVTATYEGSVISLTYDGAAMRMLKKVSYTVTFNTNGGSAVSAATVLNGKTATKPADPTREGFIFVGWYADADFKTPFAFGAQPITADTTVFAQWSKETAENREYTAKLDGNYDGATVTEAPTVGGKLFDLPELTREGYTFCGWWFSNENDGDKLSYKYESGMELKGDVTLYALWQQKPEGTKLQAPVVNVTAGAVSWNTVDGARSYLVKITNEDGEVVLEDTVGSTTCNVPFSTLAAGKYEIKVTALANSGDANNSETVRYYTNKALDKVSGFIVVGDSMLVFNTVEGAEKYLITVVCANADHDHTNFDNGTSRTFNFANCAMSEDGISFSVTAVANGYASSVSEVFTYKRALSTVEGLRFDEATETLSWNEVANAESYMVSVTCGNADHNHNFVNFGSQNFVSLKECAPCEGGIVVKVYPKTNGFISPAPVEYVFNKTSLAAPADLLISGTTLTWSANADADSYEVMINGTTYTADTNSFELSDVLDTVDGAVYTIAVRAIADKSSSWSAEVSAAYGEMGTSVVYSKGTLTWAPVIGADYYEISVNGAEAIRVEGGAFSAAVTLTKAGNNSVKVRFVDGSYKSDWVETTVFAHSVIFDTLGGSYAPAQYLAVGDPITLPAPEKAGYKFLTWYNLPGGAKDNALEYTDDLFTESGSIVLYAYYSANKYEITYNYGAGGSGDLVADKVTFESDYKLTVPTASNVAGAFGGWFSAPYGMGVQYTDADGNSLLPWTHLEGKELYAFWIDDALKFTLTKVNGKDVYAVSAGERINLVSEITVPASFKGVPVAFVAGNAFKDCTNLKVINLPETIEQISGIAPFAGCVSLEAVNVYKVADVSAPVFSSVDGVLFANDANGNIAKLRFMPLAKTGTYRIPAGITDIPAEAFKGSAISKVVIPASVASIGREAFDGCTNLATVVFEVAKDGQTEAPLAIGPRAFRGCLALEKINLPARLTDIKLQKYGIYEGVVSTVDVEYAFLGCYNLETINVATNNSIYKSVDGVLYTKDGKTLVLAPDNLAGSVVVPEGTQAIAPGAFIGCAEVVDVTLPGTLTVVGECAFYGNSNLGKLALTGTAFSDLTIDKYAFAKCTSLKTVELSAGSRLAVISDYAFSECAFEEFTLPKTLTTVGVGAFQSCSTLESVVFAEGGKTLEFGTDAFKNCSSLANVYIPANVSKLPGVFSGCAALESVEVAEDSPYFATHEGVLYDKDVTYIVFFPRAKTGTYEIPGTVTSIPNGTFRMITTLDKLIIPASVTYIGEHAFNYTQIDAIEFTGTAAEGAQLVIDRLAFDHAKIGTVNLPAHTYSIGYRAFYYAEFDTLTIAEGLKRIEDHGFEYAVMTITVPASVEYIGAYAFAGNRSDLQYNPTAILTVEGSKLLTIGDYAFYHNPNVVDVVIPASVESIGAFAYAYCDNIKTLTFAPESTLKTIGGCAFLGEYYKWSGPYNLDGVELVIPKSVTSIGARAFYDTGIKSVVFEDGGNEDLVIGTTVAYESYYGTEFYTGETFANCDYLANVVLPARVTELREKTFYYAGYNVYNGMSVTFGEGEVKLATIGAYCFDGSALASFVIPKSVRNLEPATDPVSGVVYDRLGIGEGAFSTYNLESLTFEMGGTDPLTIGAGAFESAYFETIVLPARLAPYTSSNGEVIPLLANGARVFSGCYYLSSITIEESENASLVSVGGVLMTDDKTELILCPASYEGAFEIPATVTKIYDRAFYDCTKLTALTFAPGTVDIEIGNSVFAYCEALTEIVLPDTVKQLGQDVFYGCSELVTLTLPKSLSNFDSSIITSCYKLAAINFGADGNGDFYTSVDGVVYNADKTQLVIYPAGKTSIELVVDANVKAILAYAFANNKVIQKVILPEGLVEIQERAFYKCQALTDINIPASVQLIDVEAFYYCLNLANLTFAMDGNDPLIISEGAFNQTLNLETVAFPARLYILGDDAFYAGSSTSLLSTVTFADGCTLISIGDYAFSGTSITGIVIPAGVTEIGAYAFYNNSLLETFVVSEGLVSIGDHAFAGCSELVSIEFPASLKTIGASIFYRYYYGDEYTCSKLSSVTFASGSQLEYIPAGTFAYTALESFVVPASVKGMGDGEYYSGGDNPGIFEETPLKSIEFERGSLCANIGIAAFYNCTELEFIEIPTSVSTIGEYAFASCESLEAITVPETAVNLGRSIFYNCYALADVTLETKATELPADMFENCGLLTELVIPETIATIGNGCFDGTGITAFSVDENSTYFKVVEGVLYTKNGTKIVAFPPKMAAFTTFTVPNTVTMIGDSLFAGMDNLTTVIFETGRTGNLEIGDSAFAGCTSLSDIVLPEGTVFIDDYAFEDCVSLTSFTIPSTVKSIGYRAFAYCDNIIEVCNDSNLDVTGYGHAGYNAWNIYSSNDGQSYLTVTDDGFIIYDDTETQSYSCCVTLMGYIGDEVNIVLPENIGFINDYAFYGRDDLITMFIPLSCGTTIPEGTCFWDISSTGCVGLGYDVFEGCDNLYILMEARGASYAFVDECECEYTWEYDLDANGSLSAARAVYYDYKPGTKTIYRFDTDGYAEPNTGEHSTYEIVIESSEPITVPVPEVPEGKEGMIFGGWHRNINLTDAVAYKGGETIFDTGRVTLYAKWYTPEEWKALNAGKALDDPYTTVSGEKKEFAIETPGNKFYFAVTVEAGETWNITTQNKSGNSSDHAIWIYKEDGTVEYNKYDSGYTENWNYTFSEAGTYIIAVGYFNETSTYYGVGEIYATLTKQS